MKLKDAVAKSARLRDLGRSARPAFCGRELCHQCGLQKERARLNVIGPAFSMTGGPRRSLRCTPSKMGSKAANRRAAIVLLLKAFDRLGPARDGLCQFLSDSLLPPDWAGSPSVSRSLGAVLRGAYFGRYLPNKRLPCRFLRFRGRRSQK